MTSSIDTLHITVIESEIETLRARIQPEDTGHLYTAIAVLTWRLKELKGELSSGYADRSCI